MLLPMNTSLSSFSTSGTTPFPLLFPTQISPNVIFKLTVHSSFTTPPTAQTVSKTAIRRIAEKLRSLGYIEENKTSNQPQQSQTSSPGEIFVPFPQQLPNYRVGYTVDSSWSTPQNPVPAPGSGAAISRFHELKKEADKEKKLVKKEQKVPSLAELKVSSKELRRLRTLGVGMRKKLNVGKAGITEGIVNGIHERWRGAEVVKIKCEDLCKLNMKRTHDILERKTGGLVIWRSGSTIILYRGANYKFPYFFTNVGEKNDAPHGESSSESSMDHEVDGEEQNRLAVRYGGKSATPNRYDKGAHRSLVHGVGSPNKVRFQLPGEAQLAEEADCLLDGLGPRFTDWWGYDPVPIDADLLPAIVPGYRRPFRLLPYGIKPKLTDDEMTTLRRLSRPLPSHFALGRNRRLQGLAIAMVKLWEKCEIAKIAVKHGVQNTNSDMMAEELKWLTGGTLLSRDSEFITFYRGKDFLPAAVSTAIEERRKHAVHQEKELKRGSSSIEGVPQVERRTERVARDDELQETIEKNIEHVTEQRKMKLASSRIKRISTKLSMALEKKEKAEKLLTDLEKAEEPKEAEVDKEGITEEERYMLKKVGLRMKAYLPLGRRGVFDGTVENMHLHWKYRELVKLMASERSIEDVHAAARTLEAESGGILVAVEKVNREYAIIVYRGKNYQRPVALRPQSLLNKKQALKRSIEAQRCESLKLHVLKLSKNIDHLKLQLVKDDTEPDENTKLEPSDGGGVVEYSHTEENSKSVKSTDDQESHSGLDAQSYSEETIQLHKLMDTTSKYIGPTETAVRSSSEAKVTENETTVAKSLSQDEVTCSAISNSEAHIPGDHLIESSVDVVKESEVERVSAGLPFKAAPLSNRDRLLLRKQALKMRKRPVLAVGRSNIVTGVAKTIKTHFLKNPLAIVNIKGRAEGTSVQEVIFKLEQATGAVLVSQETNKVILYRGWGMEEGQGGAKDKRHKGIVNTRQSDTREVVSPQLMEAIRLECGLQNKQEDDTL